MDGRDQPASSKELEGRWHSAQSGVLRALERKLWNDEGETLRNSTLFGRVFSPLTGDVSAPEASFFDLSAEVLVGFLHAGEKAFDGNGDCAEGGGCLLFQMVVCDDGKVVLLTVFGDKPLDDGIGGVLGGGIKNLDSSGDGRGGIFWALAVKDSNHAVLADILIVGQALDEFFPGQRHSLGVQGPQLRPGEDHGVSVH